MEQNNNTNVVDTKMDELMEACCNIVDLGIITIYNTKKDNLIETLK